MTDTPTKPCDACKGKGEIQSGPYNPRTRSFTPAWLGMSRTHEVTHECPACEGTGEVDFEGDPADPEVEALNDALPDGESGFYARHMSGDVMWHEAPDRERCGGLGWMSCHCGGDMCVCGNQGEVECYGCEDCDGTGEVPSE